MVGTCPTKGDAALNTKPGTIEVLSVGAIGRRPDELAKRNRLNAALRLNLLAVLNKNAAAIRADVQAALRPWAEQEANTEALAEWLLDRGGWEKIDAEEVEARLVTAARAEERRMLDAVEVSGDEPNPLLHMIWGKTGALLLRYSISRKERAAKTINVSFDFQPDVPEGLIMPEGWDHPRKAPERLGLDALKAGLRFLEYEGLCACLTDAAGEKGNWLAPLAAAWLSDRAQKERARIDLEAHAVGMSILTKARTASGDKWTAFARPLDIPAALAGQLDVELDGERYAAEPDMAAGAVGQSLRPRGMDLVPADWLNNPAQLCLALDLDAPPEALREYMVETAAKTAHLANLPNICPKLLGFMFAAAPMTGRPVQGTLGELANWLYPDWKKNRRSTRDLKGLGGAFVAVKGLRLVETENDGTRRPYELFTMDFALTANPEARLGWMVNPWLVQRMKGGRGGGFFLLNMTRWLALGVQNPRLFPLALRLAALWDKARVGGIYNPARLQPIDADRLAWECNALPPGAAMYRANRTDAEAGRVQLIRARSNLETDLDALRTAGLLGPWEKRKVHGRGYTVLPVPPEEYPEACKRAVSAGRRAKARKRGRG